MARQQQKGKRQVDWRAIDDEKEKYQAYLCSPEWGNLRREVHERAKGKCERCGAFPIHAVHHLTYTRKYAELPEDLQAICEFCHAFVHGKELFDPAGEMNPLVRYFALVREQKREPFPRLEIDVECCSVKPSFLVAMLGIRQLLSLIQCDVGITRAVREAVGTSIRALDATLPFDYMKYAYFGLERFSLPTYDKVRNIAGFAGSPFAVHDLSDEECPCSECNQDGDNGDGQNPNHQA